MSGIRRKDLDTGDLSLTNYGYTGQPATSDGHLFRSNRQRGESHNTYYRFPIAKSVMAGFETDKTCIIQTNQHTISFQHVWHWTQKASAVYRSKSKFVDSSDLHVPLLDIHPEGKLQREVKDIIDELDIMINVHKKQREVIRRFCKHVERILDPEGRWPDGAADHESEHQQTRPHLRAPANTHSNTLSGSNLTAWYEENIKKKERKERREQLCWFRMQSHELLAEVDDRLDELEGLKKGAESTAQSVSLLFLILHFGPDSFR